MVAGFLVVAAGVFAYSWSVIHRAHRHTEYLRSRTDHPAGKGLK